MRAIRLRPSRRFVGVLVLVGLAGAIGSCKKPDGGDAASDKALNVILITLDTTRADCLGCYGHPTIKTPNIDRLAREGVRFAQCSTCVPETLPAHTSILTGLYPFAHGSRINGDAVPDAGLVTLAELLQQRGYRTHAQVAAYVLNATWGLKQGFDSYGDITPKAGDDEDRLAGLQEFSSLPANDVADRTLEWLRGQGGQRFFLWVHFFDPHQPLTPPGRLRAQYADPYLAEIAFVDEQIGRLLAELHTRKLDERTLIVLTADHGEARGDHGEKTHGYFAYDSTLHVPLIVWGPRVVSAGRTVAAQVRTVDITPTILALLECPVPVGLHGVSLVPLLSGAADDVQLAAYGESLSAHRAFNYARLYALRNREWKYIHAPRPELYHVRDDPGEARNVALNQPERVAQMRGELEMLLAQAPAVRPAVGQLNPADAARLAALGYAGGGETDTRSEVEAFQDFSGPDLKDRLQDFLAFGEGQTDIAAGNYAAAEQRLRPLAEARPENPGYRLVLAGLLCERGAQADAVKLYEEALALQPERALTYYYLGTTLGELQRYGEAEKYLREAVRRIPDYAGARRFLGLALAQQGKLDAALIEYRTALQLSPRDAKTRGSLVSLLTALGRHAEAADSLREGMRQDPGNAALANNLAWQLATSPDANVRDGPAAAQLAEQVCRAAGPQVTADQLDTLAAAYACAGRFEDAVRTAQQAIDLAEKAANAVLVQQVQARLKLYQAGRAFVDGS